LIKPKKGEDNEGQTLGSEERELPAEG